MLLAVWLLAGGCSIRKLAVNGLAGALEGSYVAFASDEDPELVRDALPFALKTTETLLQESPDNVSLLLTACQGFVTYGVAFVSLEAERLEAESYRAARRQEERALKLYRRAQGYCFRALEATYPGLPDELMRGDPKAALAQTGPEDVRMLYWTVASWGSAIAAGLDQPELVVDLPAVRALLERAVELDSEWEEGILHDAMMLLEAAELATGSGSIERARQHYERSLALSGGLRAGTHVGWASTISVQRQDRREFERLLELALAIDPDAKVGDRLANVVAQDRARLLQERVDELFLEPLEDDDSDP